MRILTIGLFVSAAMLAAAAPAAADPPIGVGISLGFPTPIQMFAGGDPDPTRTQDVLADYNLDDLTDSPITLTASNDCEAHTWTVTDSTGAVVDHSADCPQVVQPVSETVVQGKQTSGESTVSLHVFDYKEGQTYTIHYKAFGVETTSDFQVTFLK
jgi:hypothetical protein